MSEKLYVKKIEEGIQHYKRCLTAKTGKNKIKLAKKSLKDLQIAAEQSDKLKMKDKSPLLYEYITHLNMIIAVAYTEITKTDEAVRFLNEALKSNKKATKNSTQKERAAFILSELASISMRIDQMELAKRHAFSALKYGKSMEPDSYLDLLISVNPVFIRALDVDKIKGNYRTMVKLAKKSKRKQVKAQVYFDYARYLFDVEKNYSKAKEYLNKVKTLYNALHLPQNLMILEEYYNSKFDSEGKPIIEKKDKKAK